MKTLFEARHLPSSERRYGPATEAHCQFLMWLIPAVEKFSRTQKFLLGDRIQTTALDILEALIDATYSRDRHAALARTNLGIEKLPFFFRLATALKYLDVLRYTHAARQRDDTARMIGGSSCQRHAFSVTNNNSARLAE